MDAIVKEEPFDPVWYADGCGRELEINYNEYHQTELKHKIVKEGIKMEEEEVSNHHLQEIDQAPFSEISPKVRGEILGLLAAGRSVAEVARQFGVHRNTVYRWVNHSNDGDIDLRSKPRTGWPRCTSAEQDMAIWQYVTENTLSRGGLTSVQQEFDLGCSYWTYRRRVVEAGLHHNVRCPKPLLSKAHKLCRLSFAERYVKINQAFWDLLIFSGEKSFRSDEEGHLQLWQPLWTRNHPKHKIQNKSSGCINISFWGGMTAAGPGPLVKTPPRITAKAYCKILQDNLLPYVNEIVPEGEKVMFVQGSSAVHTACITRDFFLNHQNIQILLWPDCSPDFNPIENLWRIVIQEWSADRQLTPESLEQHIRDTWTSFAQRPALLKNLVDSMGQRLQSAIQVEGDTTDY